VGDTLSLFAAGVVLFILLIASYTGRSTWIALGSTALSVAMFAGLLVFATVHDPGQAQTRLAWIADQLSLVADPQTVQTLESVLEPPPPSSPCDAGGGPECRATADAARPAAGPAPMQAAAAPGWFGLSQDPAPAPQANSQSPVAWTFDESGGQSPVTSPWGFSIRGTNVSDEALEQVQASLKPDSTERKVPLALTIEGDAAEDGNVIPADAHFSLFSATPEDGGAEQTGGAILTFRYVQAGQRKSSILYLTPAMLSRLANR
jgi:hypothetical protein